MSKRIVELVALGPELRHLAERRGKTVNEALFLVHEVLTAAFADPHSLPNDGLREHLSSQMERRLDGAAEPARKPRAWAPAIWQLTGIRRAAQKPVAAPTG
jgi:hypothetical protein